MARLYAALVYEDREPKERIFWNKINVLSLHDDTFIQTFRLSKAVVRYVCGELREDLQPLSDITTALSVESQLISSHNTRPRGIKFISMTRKMSKAQEEIMLDFVMNNRIMITRDGSVPKNQVKRKWVELAHMLNAEPTGVVKTDDKWKKSFGDWKGYVKSKAAKRYQRRQETGTGVTGDEPNPLSELEEKLLFLTGRISAQGSQKIKESPVFVDVDTENINDADNSNNFENGVFSDDDENIDASTPAPTTTSSNAAQLFDRKCSRDKFVSRRMTITEELSNKLIQSSQKQNKENERLAEAAENEVKLKQQKLEMI